MTLKELSQLYHLNREIEQDKERLERLKSAITSPTGPNLSGMPSGGSRENRLEKLIAEMVDLEAIISSKMTQCMHERSRLERYIADIPDSYTRQVFTARFVQGLSWEQVASRIGGITADAARMMCNRHIKRENRLN